MGREYIKLKATNSMMIRILKSICDSKDPLVSNEDKNKAKEFVNNQDSRVLFKAIVDIGINTKSSLLKSICDLDRYYVLE